MKSASQAKAGHLLAASVFSLAHAPPDVAVVVFLLLLFQFINGMIHVLADASFWSEGGSVFFAAAWRGHEAGIFQPHAGYLNAVPRILALIFEPFDLKAQPTLYLMAWLVLSALLLFSSLASWKWARVGADLRWGPQVEMLEQSGQGSVKWRPGWEMWLRITPREAKMLFPAP